jgi:hypothetical protein
MSEETQSSEATETTAAPENDAAAAQQQLDNPPKRPDFAPSPGTRHVFDPKRGMWLVERDDREDSLATEKAKAPDAKEEGQEQEAPRGVELPETLPDYVRDNPETQALVAEGVSAMQRDGQYSDQQVQRVVDLVAQFELEIGAEQPPLVEEDRIRAILRARWGQYHDKRLASVNAYVNSRPALKAYLNRTGAGNQLSVLEALAMIADGSMAVTPARAAEILEEQRRDPKSPLRDPYHKGHGLAVQTAKVLADVVDRGEKNAAKGKGRQSNVDELVKDRTAKEPVGDSPEGKLDAELKTLRQSPAYFDKSRPEHKAIVERVRQIYRERYPS